MENLLTYILQVNLLLVIVYLGYYYLLRKLTFYTLNRIYFVIAAVYAFVYPLLDFKQWFLKDTAVGIPVLWDYVSVDKVEQISKDYSLYDFLLGSIALGGLVLLLRLIIQVFSLVRIHLYSKDSKWHHFFFRDVVFPIVPFSFFNRIYLHKAQHQEDELYDIFEHESIHVKGHHTWDVLLFEIILIGCWYNPFVWLMRNAVRQNLEYLTDQQVLNKGVDRQTYQYSLLHVTQRGAAVGISNQFNFKTLKKRIMMMNKKRSSRLELSKYAFLLPIILLAGASFTVSQAESKIEEVVAVVKETPIDVALPKPQVEIEDLIITQDSSKTDNLPKTDNLTLPIVIESVGYLLDDRLVNIDEMKKIGPKDLESVVVNRDNEITEKYDKKTIIDFKTKKYSGTLGTPSQFSAISFENNNLSFSGDAIVVPVNGKSKFSSVQANDFVFQAQSYPLLAPNFDRKAFEKGNFYFIIDDKLVSLDEFIGFPREEISGVDIYKDKDEIIRKIGKANADGLFVMTSKKAVNQDASIKEHNKVVRLGPKKAYNDLSPEERPLFVVDGVVKTDDDMRTLLPDDIESVTILKDDKAVAVYGEPGRNGVIEVITKTKKQVEKAIRKFVEKEIDEERSR